MDVPVCNALTNGADKTNKAFADSRNASGHHQTGGDYQWGTSIRPLTDSVKYSPANKDIILSGKVDGDSIRISVKDFGIALSDHQKDRIFEGFYRVDDKNYAASVV